MKHLYNSKSHRTFCTVKHPVVNDNTSVLGTQLASYEPTCPICLQWWPEYDRIRPDVSIADLLRPHLNELNN